MSVSDPVWPSSPLSAAATAFATLTCDPNPLSLDLGPLVAAFPDAGLPSGVLPLPQRRQMRWWWAAVWMTGEVGAGEVEGAVGERPAVSDTDAAPGPAQPVSPTVAQPLQGLSPIAAEPPHPSVAPTEPVVQLTDVVAEPAAQPADVAAQPTGLVPQPADPRITSGADVARSSPRGPRSGNEPDDESAAQSDDDAPPPALESRSGSEPDDESAAQSGSPSAAEPPDRPHDDTDSPNVVPAAPREAIAYWQRRHPGISIEDLAERVGKSPRQIRRYLRQPAGNAAKRVNGHRNDTLADTFRSPRP